MATARHRTTSRASRSTGELHTDALHLARELAGSLQQQLQAVREDANARELQQRQDVLERERRTLADARHQFDAAAAREERMYDQFNAFMERSRTDLLQMAEQKERAAKLEAQLQASAAASAAAMPVDQRQPVVANVSEIKQYNKACVMSSLSTAVTENSATQQNNVIPAVVMQDVLIDIEDAQAEPEFISGSPQPPIHLMHTTSSSQDRSRATSTSATTSGLQIQQSHMQNISSPHADESANNNNTCSTLQTAAYCQPHNTHHTLSFIYSSYGYGLSVRPCEPCIHVSHQHSHTTATPDYTQPTPNTHTEHSSDT